jgi:hypothetical protein
MEPRTGTMFGGPDGRVRMDYVHDGLHRSATWEPLEGGLLETVFDSSGAILRRELFGAMSGPAATDARIQQFSRDNGITPILSSQEYKPVKISKECPSCKNAALRVHFGVEDGGVVPVMPVYICASCNGRSYHITDEYLDFLVSGKKDLFSKEELKEMEATREAFRKELKEYIIRIFASKRIMCIR